MPLTLEERKAVATMSRLADALNDFAELTRSQDAKRRVYVQEMISDTHIAERINNLQEEVGAVISIDYIERDVPTSATNIMRRVVYHYDK